ncbi:MAG TPA: hypothetical protein VFS34_06125 [Thermoanaerobaculia bacterium]|nr:hypothetical protein [Thermoanaerobaculia bacterium]
MTDPGIHKERFIRLVRSVSRLARVALLGPLWMTVTVSALTCAGVGADSGSSAKRAGDLELALEE